MCTFLEPNILYTRLLRLQNAHSFHMENLNPFSNFNKDDAFTLKGAFTSTRRVYITMGPCQFKLKDGSSCRCASGECAFSPGNSRSSINCNNCEHLMELHGDYSKHHIITLKAAFCVKSLMDVQKTKAMFPITFPDHL